MDHVSPHSYSFAFKSAAENLDVPGFQHFAGDNALEATLGWIDGLTDGLKATGRKPKRIEVSASLLPVIQNSSHAFKPGLYKDIPYEAGEDNYGNKRIYIEM